MTCMAKEDPFSVSKLLIKLPSLWGLEEALHQFVSIFPPALMQRTGYSKALRPDWQRAVPRASVPPRRPSVRKRVLCAGTAQEIWGWSHKLSDLSQI